MVKKGKGGRGMASWMVHLRVAQALGAPFTGTPQEATAYYVGAVGPDCGAYIAENVFDPPTQVTHWAPDGYKRNCDALAFRAAYLEGKALSPEARAFYTAYYIHLLTDCAWVREIVEPVRAAAGTAFGTPEDIALTLEQKKDWYGLDMQFFSENPGFEPLRVLAGAGNFPNEYLPYYGPDALAVQMKNIVEYYRTGAAPQGHTYRWLTKEGMDTFIRRNACEIRPLLQGL